MTDDTNPMFCERCNAAVRLEKYDNYGRLILRCGCDTTRSIKVSQALPEEWSA